MEGDICARLQTLPEVLTMLKKLLCKAGFFSIFVSNFKCICLKLQNVFVDHMEEIIVEDKIILRVLYLSLITKCIAEEIFVQGRILLRFLIYLESQILFDYEYNIFDNLLICTGPPFVRSVTREWKEGRWWIVTKCQNRVCNKFCNKDCNKVSK